MDDIDITIIGGGLSAIYSYWGCLDAGYHPGQIEVLHSQRELPVGAIFMYESPIPWQFTNVTSVLLGTCDGYSMNQWNQVRKTSAHMRFRNGDFPVVTENLYMLDEMFVTLWGMIPNKKEAGFFTEDQLADYKKRRRAVICTFPNQRIRHNYKDNGFIQHIPIHTNTIASDKHIVIYNGEPHIPWVRQTIIPGKIFTEYPFMSDPQGILDYEKDRKNLDGRISLVPDLHPDTPALDWDIRKEGNLFRVGRLSCFTPGYLSHQARRETFRFLREL